MGDLYRGIAKAEEEEQKKLEKEDRKKRREARNKEFLEKKERRRALHQLALVQKIPDELENSILGYVEGVEGNKMPTWSDVDHIDINMINEKLATFSHLQPLIEKEHTYSDREYTNDEEKTYSETKWWLATSIRTAAVMGRIDIVELLINAGTSSGFIYKQLGRDGRTPLSYAAEKGHTEIVNLLIDEGANIKDSDKDGRTPLSYAAEEGHTEIVNRLIEAGVNIKYGDKDGRTSLLYAVEKGHTVIAQKLIEEGADVNTKDEDGMTILSYAVEKGFLGIAKILIDNGASVIDTKSRKSQSLTSRPLRIAVLSGHRAFVCMLVDVLENIELNTNTNAKLNNSVKIEIIQNTLEYTLNILEMDLYDTKNLYRPLAYTKHTQTQIEKVRMQIEKVNKNIQFLITYLSRFISPTHITNNKEQAVIKEKEGINNFNNNTENYINNKRGRNYIKRINTRIADLLKELEGLKTGGKRKNNKTICKRKTDKHKSKRKGKGKTRKTRKTRKARKTRKTRKTR